MPAPGRVGEALDAFEGDPSGPDEGVGPGFAARVFGQERLAGRPPGVLAVRGQEPRQVLADRGPVVLAVERVGEGADELEAGLEGGRGTSGAAAPRFVLAEEGGDHLDGMAGRGLEDPGGVGGADLPGLGEEPRQVEKPGLVRLARRPEGGVSAEFGHEMDHGVAQRVAHAGRIVARAPEVGELAGRVAGQALAVLPDAHERLPGLVEDPVPRPGLEVDRSLGFDPLAPADVPGVGVIVGDERIGVEEIEHVALERGVRPGLVLEEADRRLVAVEGSPQLALPDQGPGPEPGVAALAGVFAEAGALGRGGLELLLGDELLDRFAGRLAADPAGIRLRSSGASLSAGLGYRVDKAGRR